MKNFLFLLIMLLVCRFLVAQEPVRPSAVPKDSVTSGFKTGTTAPLLYEPPLSTTGLNFDLQDIPAFTPKITVPLFDLSAYQRNKWQVFSTNGHESGFLLSGPFYLPGWGTLFNQAVYHASNKLTIGGSSFGVNSLWRAPLPAFKGNNFDYRGVSVFLEYKVSENFRIGGGVTISGHPIQP